MFFICDPTQGKGVGKTRVFCGGEQRVKRVLRTVGSQGAK